MAVPRHYIPSLNLHAVVDVLEPRQKFSVHFMQHCIRQLSTANKWMGPGREGTQARTRSWSTYVPLSLCISGVPSLHILPCIVGNLLLSNRESAKKYQVGWWGFVIVREGQHCTGERGGPYQHLPPATTTT